MVAHRARRSLSLLEVILSLSLLLAFLPALLPRSHTEAGALRERLESTQARLIVESELERATSLELQAGTTRLSLEPYPSAEQLEGVTLERRVEAAPGQPGLWEVRVSARWTSVAVTARDEVKAESLTTWVAK